MRLTEPLVEDNHILSGLALLEMFGQIRPIRLIGILLLFFLYLHVPQIQFNHSTVKSQLVEGSVKVKDR